MCCIAAFDDFAQQMLISCLPFLSHSSMSVLFTLFKAVLIHSVAPFHVDPFCGGFMETHSRCCFDQVIQSDVPEPFAPFSGLVVQELIRWAGKISPRIMNPMF